MFCLGMLKLYEGQISLEFCRLHSTFFNSNLSCKFQKITNFILGSGKYIFNNKVGTEKI